jgi:hypothetical protein
MLVAERSKRSALRTIFWIIGIAAALWNAWSSRFFLSSPDGISYLDIADSYLRGDWHAAINAYWSPLYSWLLSAALFFARPSPASEFAVVKAINLLSFLVALGCFEFLLREILLYYRSSEDEEDLLPDATFRIAGYSIFLWASLRWTGVQSDTPDLLTSAAAYAAVGLSLRARRSPGEISGFISLGVVMAFGYFSKSVFFPFAFVLMLVCFIALVHSKSDRIKVLLAALIFFLLTAPWVLDVSKVKGHLTFGESGKLNYAWFVNPGFRSPNHWQGEENIGTPQHPERKIFDQPAAFEFGYPIAGTYPPWFDPSYWFAGLSVKFQMQNHLHVLWRNTLFYYDHFLRFLMIAVLVFLLTGGAFRSFLKSLCSNWMILIPAIAGLGLYVSAKTHTSMRYIAPFAALLFVGVLASFRFHHGRRQKIRIPVLNLGAVIMIVLAIVGSVIAKPDGMPPWRIAAAAQQTGVQRGDRIAIIGDEDDFVYWARLAGVKIIAQVPDEKAFTAYTENQEKLMAAFRDAGAREVLILTEAYPTGWRPIAGTRYSIRFL